MKERANAGITPAARDKESIACPSESAHIPPQRSGDKSDDKPFKSFTGEHTAIREKRTGGTQTVIRAERENDLPPETSRANAPAKAIRAQTKVKLPLLSTPTKSSADRHEETDG